MAMTLGARVRKGKNFSADEEQQLCWSFMHILQDPRTGNGQRAVAFWERVCKLYHENRPLGIAERPSRSLETKWGIVKHDVAKFCSVYKSVLSCRESGTSLDDILERELELYKQRHPRHAATIRFPSLLESFEGRPPVVGFYRPRERPGVAQPIGDAKVHNEQ